MAATQKPEYLAVGVTGGIGSGKSTVCAVFESLGRPVLRADELAREVMEADSGLRDRLIRAFGGEVFGADGRLARRWLADRVFRDPGAVETLNGLVHPAVFLRIERLIDDMKPQTRFPYVLIEAALLYESGYDNRLDYVITVEADEAVRISRIVERDRTTEEAVRARMRFQLDPSRTRKRADFVITNDGAVDAIAPAVALLHRILSSLAAARR